MYVIQPFFVFVFFGVFVCFTCIYSQNRKSLKPLDLQFLCFISLGGLWCFGSPPARQECHINITREVFQAWLKDPEFVRVLEEAEVDISNKRLGPAT